MNHRSLSSRGLDLLTAAGIPLARATGDARLTETKLVKRGQGLILTACLTVCLACVAQQADGQTQGGAKSVRAEVVQPVRRTVTRSLTLPATLAADEQVDLFAKASGFVDKIDYDIGDPVSAGEVLVTLDIPEMADHAARQAAVVRARKAGVEAMRARVAQADRDVESAKAEVQRAEAENELARLNLKRKEELREGNAIPQQDLDEARSAAAVSQAQLMIARAGIAGAQAVLRSSQADVSVAQADVAVAKAEASRLETLMEYARIPAPFDGVVTMRHVDHGAFVRSATEGAAVALLRVAKMDKIRVQVDVPESDAAYVHRGTKANVRIRALGTDAVNATISRTAQSLDPATRTMRAEIDVPNADGRLLPGMFADVGIELEVKSQALMIPSKAIRTLNGKTVVYVAQGGVAQAIVVSVGYEDGIQAEVLSGLQGDEQVIIAANSTIVAGTAVSVTSSGT